MWCKFEEIEDVEDTEDKNPLTRTTRIKRKFQNHDVPDDPIKDATILATQEILCKSIKKNPTSPASIDPALKKRSLAPQGTDSPCTKKKGFYGSGYDAPGTEKERRNPQLSLHHNPSLRNPTSPIGKYPLLIFFFFFFFEH